MRCYRLCESRFRALDGAGARLYGGRWNHPGRAVVYTCSSRALAALELLTRIRRTDAPPDLVLLTIELPESAGIEQVMPRRLPADWQTVPAPRACQDLGERWLRKGRDLVLQVPSVLVPEEPDFVINPGHPGFVAVRVVAGRPFRFDHRLAR